MIREYLYYSYNVPDSMSWSFDKARVEIKFKDRSIPRQFFTVHNDHVLGSMQHFRDFGHSDEIMRLLKHEPEGLMTPNVEAATPLIQTEADLKLAATGQSVEPDLGGYSYRQFLTSTACSTRRSIIVTLECSMRLARFTFEEYA